MRPLPRTKYQISLNGLLRATALDTCCGGNEKCAMPPLFAVASSLTSEPSGALASGMEANRLVSDLSSGGSCSRSLTSSLVQPPQEHIEAVLPEERLALEDHRRVRPSGPAARKRPVVHRLTGSS